MSASENQAQGNVEKFIHDVTYQMLKVKTRDIKFTKGDVNKVELPYREYLAAILLAGSEFKLMYMVHFWLEDAKYLVSNSLDKNAADVEYWRAIDFFKEYCNVIAGKTKKAFKAQGIHLNQSLPIGIGGFNLALFDEKGPKEKRLYWSQNTDSLEIDFSARYSILDPAVTAKLETLPNYADLKEETSIEFF